MYFHKTINDVKFSKIDTIHQLVILSYAINNTIINLFINNMNTNKKDYMLTILKILSSNRMIIIAKAHIV